MKAQLPPGEEPPRVLGCLLGFQTGNREVEICNSFEVPYTMTPSDVPGGPDVPVFNTTFLGQQQERYKQTFSQWDVVGWYSTGQEVVPQVDLQIHRSLAALNESPVFMLFNPKANLGAANSGAAGGAGGKSDGGPGVATKDLPISLYETVVHATDATTAAHQTFEPAEYKIETVEAERISVDHVARMSAEQSAPAGQYVAHLGSVASAVEMLNSRVETLLLHLHDVDAGRTPADHGVLRAAAALVKQLPAAGSGNFRKGFLAEYNDTLLITYLAAVTKGTAELDVYTERFNTAYDKHSRRRGF